MLPAARAVGVEQEIALFAEQPEAVADLPGNLHRSVGAPCAAAGALCAAAVRRRGCERADAAASSAHRIIERR